MDNAGEGRLDVVALFHLGRYAPGEDNGREYSLSQLPKVRGQYSRAGLIFVNVRYRGAETAETVWIHECVLE